MPSYLLTTILSSLWEENNMVMVKVKIFNLNQEGLITYYFSRGFKNSEIVLRLYGSKISYNNICEY